MATDPIDRMFRLYYGNINTTKFDKPYDFGNLLFDSNDTCNLHCGYCHNPRTLFTVSEEDFKKFIDTQIRSIQTFQIGCAMEPTMDKRMANFALMIGKSKVRPKRRFKIQTNGTLLHIHKMELLKEAGVNWFSFSLDSMDPKIHDELRDGSDLNLITQNIKNLRRDWPSVGMQFVVTLTNINVVGLEKVIEFAIDNKANRVCIRRMFHYPNSAVIKDHEKMKAWTMTNDTFRSIYTPLQEKYGSHIDFYISDEEKLKR